MPCFCTENCTETEWPSFTYVTSQGYSGPTAAELSSCNRNQGPQNLNHLSPGPFQGSFLHPCADPPRAYPSHLKSPWERCLSRRPVPEECSSTGDDKEDGQRKRRVGRQFNRGRGQESHREHWSNLVKDGTRAPGHRAHHGQFWGCSQASTLKPPLAESEKHAARYWKANIPSEFWLFFLSPAAQIQIHDFISDKDLPTDWQQDVTFILCILQKRTTPRDMYKDTSKSKQKINSQIHGDASKKWGTSL